VLCRHWTWMHHSSNTSSSAALPHGAHISVQVQAPPCCNVELRTLSPCGRCIWSLLKLCYVAAYAASTATCKDVNCGRALIHKEP
jgi:hypothetical protein